MVRVLGRGIDALREFIKKCLEVGGIPVIRTRYGGRRFPDNAVVVACMGKAHLVPGGTILDIPPDIIEQCEKTKGDWKWLVERLGIHVPGIH